MAISIIDYISSSGSDGYEHLRNAIQYILNPEKTAGGVNTGTVNLHSGVQADAILNDMIATKEFYGKTDKRQGYHMILSFVPGETDEKTAAEITAKFTERYLGERFEAVWAVHNDRPHMHGHIIFNSVSIADGLKYHYATGDWARSIQPIVNDLCREYGLSTIRIDRMKGNELETEEEGPDGFYADPYGERAAARAKGQAASGKKRMTHEEWEAEKNGCLTGREKIRMDIDEAVLLSDDYRQFIAEMKRKGYQVKEGKYLSLLPEWRERPVRSYRLGDAYSVPAIKERIRKNLSFEPPESGTFPKIPEAFPPEIKTELQRIAGETGMSQKKNQKRHMTPDQKRRAAAAFRQGKLHALRRSPAYNKEALARFYQLRREMAYANEHRIRDLSWIDSRLKAVTEEEKDLFRRRNTVYRGGDGPEKKKIRQALSELRKEKRILQGLRRDLGSLLRQAVLSSIKESEESMNENTRI